MKPKNRGGISGVISMILMIAITIVAVAIIWGVINNFISNKTKSAECIGVFEKVLINNYYTCYNSSSDELKISVELKDIKVDSAIVAVYDESKSKTFELPSAGYFYVKPYSGSYNDALILPSQNSASTYIFNVNSSGIENASMIKISPKIEGYQCEVSDTLLNIDDC